MLSRCLGFKTNLLVRHVMEGLLSERPYLVEDTPIAPDVAGHGVATILQRLGGRPLHGDLPSVGDVEILVLEFPRETKISNLRGIQLTRSIFEKDLLIMLLCALI